MSDLNDKKVIIYSTTWCAFCSTEKQWMDKLGVPVEIKDVEEDKAAYEELMGKIGGKFQGVPVTDIAGDVILGFDRPKLQASLEKNNLIPA